MNSAILAQQFVTALGERLGCIVLVTDDAQLRRFPDDALADLDDVEVKGLGLRSESVLEELVTTVGEPEQQQMSRDRDETLHDFSLRVRKVGDDLNLEIGIDNRQRQNDVDRLVHSGKRHRVHDTAGGANKLARRIETQWSREKYKWTRQNDATVSSDRNHALNSHPTCLVKRPLKTDKMQIPNRRPDSLRINF
jgi:hypothetical protein